MRTFLRGVLSRRFGYDGWALRVRGAKSPLDWSASTTREEARGVLRDLRERDIAWQTMDIEIVKVRIRVEVVE